MIWLDRRDVEAFHSLQIIEFGGLPGLRDAGALESAIARPLNLSAYLEPSVFECAASYAFGIARNHPFADGNKRTALVASFTFLDLNGWEVTAPEEQAVLVFLDLASGKMPEKELARWLESNSRRNSPRKSK